VTTIAYKDGVLAADTVMYQGGTMMGNVIKIARRDDGDMAGAAGNANFNALFIAWFLAGENGEPPKATESERHHDRGVIFRKAGGIDVFEVNGSFRCEAEYFAFGSGMDYALGAMFAGAGAGTAVRAAVKHDPHSGGDVTVLHA
jgi:ATP-dependent HslUV protease subunit HslV